MKLLRSLAPLLCLLPSLAQAGATLPPTNLSSYLDAPFDQAPGSFGLIGAARINGSYRGPLYRVRRDDNATLDVYAPFSSAYGWPSKAALSAWLNGSPGFVQIAYFQDGTGRTIDMSATPSAQPLIDMETDQPVWNFDGTRSKLDLASYLSVTQNVSGLTVVAVRRHNVSRNAGTDRPLFYASTGTGVNRAYMGPQVGFNDAAGGRRNDADSLVRSPGFALNTNWAVEVARFDYANAKLTHQRGSETEVVSPFLTAGSTSNTASTVGAIGYSTGNNMLNGKIAAFAIFQSVLTDTQVAPVMTALAKLQQSIPARPSQFVSWGNALTNGTYTLVPAVTNVTPLGVSTQTPAPAAQGTIDGATPSAADILSQQYHHHNRIAINNGRLWIAYTSGLSNEDGQGQYVGYQTSTDFASAPTPSFTPPAVGVPSQDTMSTAVSTGRILWTRSFAKLNGNLYLIAAVQSAFNTNIGTLAVKCNDDGSVGTPFLISPETYTALSGFPQYIYDPVLGPQLLAIANVYGIWGGSNPGYTTTSLIGTLSFGSTTNYWTEPATFPLDAGGQNLQRLWRRIGLGGSTYKWSQRSSDGGKTWTALTLSDVPDQASAATGLLLPDGRIAVIGNAIDYDATNHPRDPLYLALFNGSTGVLSSLYAVRQGLTGTPTYAGSNKTGGAQYPSAVTDGTNLYVSYSMQKESIGFSRIPLSGL